MIRRSHLRFYLISIMAFMISLPTWASAGDVGNITQVEQRVDYQKGETGTLIPAKVKQPVEVKDVLQTYEVSRAQVLFLDQTTLTVAPKSRVAVESYMFDPAKFERGGSFNLIRGVIKVVVPASEKLQKSTFEIKTPTATMGIRGTELFAISGNNFTVVYAVNGIVCLKSNPKEPGKYEVVQPAPGEEGVICLDPNTMSVILANQLPSSPMPVSPAVLAAVEGLLDTGINDVPGTCVLSTLPGVDLSAVVNDLLARGADPTALTESLNLVCATLPSGEGAEAAGVATPTLPTFPGEHLGGGPVPGPAPSPSI